MRRYRPLLFIALLALVVTLVALFDLAHHLDLATLKGQQAALQARVSESPRATSLVYFLVYVVVTALSIPGAVPLSLIGAAIFGFWWALLLVSCASTLGATLAMLVSRHLLRDWARARLGQRLRAIDAGLARDGPLYLFGLRMAPFMPFVLINLAFGLTRIRVWTYAWVSQLGMLAGSVLYLNAGTQLAQVQGVGGLLDPGLLLAFVLLGLFPLLGRRVYDGLCARRVYAGWRRPPRFDYDLVVVGAGAGGLVSAYLGAAAQARVALIEAGTMGGDCLNSGCVPSKALIATTRLLHRARHAQGVGLQGTSIPFTFSAVMARVRQAVAEVAPHDSEARYRALGVEVVRGHGRLLSPWSVEVAGRVLTTRAIVIATGARPHLPPLDGLDRLAWYTSATLWRMEQLPAQLVVLGGGAVGCELAQCFARLGSEVTMVVRGTRLLPALDEEPAEAVAEALRAEGVEILTAHQALRGESGEGEGRWLVVADPEGRERHLPCSALLMAVGRVAHTQGLGLEVLQIPLERDGRIVTDPWLRTRYPNIFAVGDVAGPWQLTHAAAHQAQTAVVNALLAPWWRRKLPTAIMPRVLFTDPEVAQVGHGVASAEAAGLPFELTRYALAELDRAIVDASRVGYIQLLTQPGRGRILGATLVGEGAGELLTPITLAMQHGLGMKALLATLHPYPTRGETLRATAGVWAQRRTSAHLRALLRRWHAWRRG